MTDIRIGLLEDDPDQSAVLKLWLEDAGYTVEVFPRGPEFIRAVQSLGFDLLILDWNLPEMSGFEVLEWIRGNVRWRIPVLFLTTRREESHVVSALAAGADDFVTKPAKHRELLARVNALARRSGLYQESMDKIIVGDIHFDKNLLEVTVAGKPVSLTRREFDLSYFLFSNIGKILSRKRLLNQVWNLGSDVTTRTVDTHISRVRSKLQLRPERGWQLVSVYHYGYRLEQVETG